MGFKKGFDLPIALKLGSNWVLFMWYIESLGYELPRLGVVTVESKDLDALLLKLRREKKRKAF